MDKLQQLLLPDTSTLLNVMEALDKNASGVVLMVDKAGVLCGIFTDGDVRRALLKGAAKTDTASEYMNRNFTYGTIHQTHQQHIAMLNDKIRHLPIVDDDQHPVDMQSWADFWRLPVMEPSLGGNELKYVSDCVTSGWISSKGEYVTKFEDAFKDFLGVKYALSTTSGTTALHLALVALDIKAGDEVLVPSLTFGASANVVIHCGATPVFVDVDSATWTIDVNDAERKITPRTKAIMPVHLYGHPADMLPLMELAEKHNLYIVEDAAEAMGAEYRGKKIGTIGHIAAFSFFANKIITTGEGGMVTTNDPALFEKMAIMRSHGMQPDKRYWHDYAGYNYRMTNLQAAIGLAQMERVHEFLSYREKIVQRYHDGLRDIPGITRPPEADWAKNVYWLYSIVIDPTVTGINRDALMTKLADYGIETRPFFYPLHIQPAYQQPTDDSAYPVSTMLADNGMSLPTGNAIQFEQIDFVCHAIRSIIEKAHINSR